MDWFGRLIQKVIDLTMAWVANKGIYDIYIYIYFSLYTYIYITIQVTFTGGVPK